MDLVSTAPTSDMRDMRRRYFLSEIGVHGNADTLEQQVDAALGILTAKQRAIIIRRFALGDDDGARRTLQAIAEALGVSKQYINEVETKSIQKLRAFPGLVKEPV
jgi:DNA-directed RNA polymerase sigma subunit (sigma70/sigma32)